MTPPKKDPRNKSNVTKTPDKDNTPVKPGTPSVNEAIAKLNKEMTERFENLGETLNTIMADNRNFSAEMLALQNKVTDLENKNKGLESRCDVLEIENNRLKFTIANTQKLQSDLEQNSRKYNIIFRNLNVKVDEKPEDCWAKVKKVIDPLVKENIDSTVMGACHPIPAKKGSTSIICKFLNLHLVEDIYRARKLTQQMDDELRAELGVPSGKNVTLHPNLSVLNRSLMTQAFELKEQCNWKFIWSDLRGNIRARESEKSDIKDITCTDDIFSADTNVKMSTVLEKSIFC